ncbi:MAG: bifunctional 4-hydroxy-2-oxoglutarate aldolase/2-dehydro-3-deoxy-phosphogluconate aldolase [Caulobacterales bacterium]
MRIEDILSAGPVMPVVTIDDPASAAPLARALLAGGLRAIEVTLRTDAALRAIEAIAREVPDALVGAGTVLTPDDLRAAIAAGARFAVSPGSTAALLEAGRQASIPYLPAIATASELMRGLEHGYGAFKFFPAAQAGGVEALRSLAGPFPRVRFCPTGGIDMGSAGDYLALANVLCVGGSWVTPKSALASGDFAKIEALARAAAALNSATSAAGSQSPGYAGPRADAIRRGS